MTKTIRTLSLFIGLIILVAMLALPAGRPPQAQAIYQTPTAQSDGRIIYTVKKNDTCLSIALLNNVSLDTLRELNSLKDANCTITEGQKLLLGKVVILTPTIGPTPTATPILPSPTPFAGTGKICVVLFLDVNGNAMVDAGEGPLAGGAISLVDRKGKVSLTGSTSGDPEAPQCFADLNEGDYNISVAVPQGYNATTSMNQPLSLKAGDNSYINFGAQQSLQAAPEVSSTDPGEQRSPLLALAGAALVLIGIGLGIFLKLMNRVK